jgi:WS/DGAT/MGAT family acyltransferase
MQLAAGAGTPAAGHVGVVLVLDTGKGFVTADAARLLGVRIRGVPRLRQRLSGGPRPYWADDPGFDLGGHVREVRCPPPGDERALLDLAAAELEKPLPRSRPLWSAVFVTGLAHGGTGLVIVVDHVLADGVAGLAVLAALLDPAYPAPARATDRGQRDIDLTRRGHGAIDLTHGAGRGGIRQGLAELGGVRPPRRLARSSLNRPTGPRRRLDVVTADLAAVRAFAHAHGGTVNDVVVASVAGALRDLLASRGEPLDRVTISVPVSARQAADTGVLGNKVGVMPVSVPGDGTLGARVSAVAAITRTRKSRARGASASLLVPVFLLLARAGLLRWFVNRQRLVHTFVTNLRGPRQPLAFGGAPVRTVIPIPSTTGNVTVTFGALSYAGALRVTVLSDPVQVPDVALLTAALRTALDAIPAPQAPIPLS